MSRDQVQLEAQQLTGQIQELQQQLQQVNHHSHTARHFWASAIQLWNVSLGKRYLIHPIALYNQNYLDT